MSNNLRHPSQAEPEAARLLFPGTSIGGSVAVGRTVGVVGRTVAGER